MSSDAAAQALRALSQFLVAERSLGDTLLRVSEITIEALPAADMAGISMLGEDGRPTTGVFTDDEAPEIDAAVDDYPDFARVAQSFGVASTLSLPLMAADNGLGALNLYAKERKAFTTDDEAAGMELAAAASVVMANAGAYWEASQLSEQLTEAMRSRAVIEQAKGIIMARSPEMTADGAFDVLRRASQRENVKLREIAQRLVDRKLGARDISLR